MKKPTNKDLVHLYYEELWNKRNKALINILFDENITFYSSLGLEINGKKEFEEYMNTIHSAIPNLFHSIIDIISDDKSVAVRAIYTGKHTGKLFEYSATNNRIFYNGASFFKFKNGKISSICVVANLNTLIKQIESKNNE